MLNTAKHYRLRGYHPLRHRFPTDFDLVFGFLLRAIPAETATTLPQPPHRNACRLSHDMGLASSDFARHYSRNHFCFLFLRVLRCFTSPCSLHTPYFIQMRVTGHDSSWVSPFGHPRINARLPTPQGISQAPTSFIGSRCQGIHHVPLTTCPQQTTNTHNNPTPNPPPKRQARSRAVTNRQRPSQLSLWNKPIKRTHKTITKQTLLLMLASTMKKSNNQKPNQPQPSPHPDQQSK